MFGESGGEDTIQLVITRNQSWPWVLGMGTWASLRGYCSTFQSPFRSLSFLIWMRQKTARSFSKFLFTPGSETLTSQDPLMPEEVDPKLHMKDN